MPTFCDRDGMCVEIEKLEASLRQAEAEIAELRADLVWAVRDADCSTLLSNNGRRTFRSESFSGVKVIPTDGTDAGLIAAVRSARKGGE